MSHSAPASLLRPMEVRRKTLMGPGPANCSPRVLNAMSQPLLGHLHPDFCVIMGPLTSRAKRFMLVTELSVVTKALSWKDQLIGNF